MLIQFTTVEKLGKKKFKRPKNFKIKISFLRIK